MLYRRIQSMRQLKIEPQNVATSASKNDLLKDTRTSDSYNNLFEMPVLFYPLSLIALLTNKVTIYFVLTAWCYVILRFIHSVIQCAYNRAIHKFSVFIASTVALTALVCQSIFTLAVN